MRSWCWYFGVAALTSSRTRWIVDGRVFGSPFDFRPSTLRFCHCFFFSFDIKNYKSTSAICSTDRSILDFASCVNRSRVFHNFLAMGEGMQTSAFSEPKKRRGPCSRARDQSAPCLFSVDFRIRFFGAIWSLDTPFIYRNPGQIVIKVTMFLDFPLLFTLWAHLNGERYIFGNKKLISMDFKLISKEKRVRILSGNSVLVANNKIIRN